MIKYLSKNVWAHITRLARRSGRRFVAVPYCSADAPKLIPLRRGDILVTDFSPTAVRAGQTSPQAILRFLRRGVQVWSNPDLHAKVYVLGRRAIVGSMNASRHSQKSLQEAAVETDEGRTVRAARRSVESLRVESIGIQYAMKMAKIYRPPQMGGGRSRQDEAVSTSDFGPVWLVQTERVKWDELTISVNRVTKPIARRKIAEPKTTELDQFEWTAGLLYRRLRTRDLVIESVKESEREKMVHPPGRVVHIKRFGPPGGRRMLVYVERPRGLRRYNLMRIQQRLGSLSDPLVHMRQAAVRAHDMTMVESIFRLWRSRIKG